MKNFEQQSEQIILEEEGRGHGDEIKGEKMEESFQKKWRAIVKENIDSFSEDFQKIYKQKKARKISSDEMSIFNKAINEFWWKKFGMNRATWNKQKKEWRKKKNIIEEGAKREKKVGDEAMDDVQLSECKDAEKIVVKKELKESFKKEWLEIMEENIDSFSEDIQEILRRRSTNLDSGEQGKLDRMRDKFWREKFGIQFVKWSSRKKQARNQKRKIKMKDDKLIHLEKLKMKDRKLIHLEKLKELNLFLEKISENLRKENAPVDSSCRIKVNYFANFYGKNDIKHDEKMKPTIDFRIGGVTGEKLEIIKTIIFNKFLGDRFVIVRSSIYDDIFNGVDNVVIEKATGNLVCMFDEISVGALKERKRVMNIAKKWQKVIKINKSGGAKLKYGLDLKKNDETGELSFEPATIDNIPIFALMLNAEDTLKLEKEIVSHPLDEVSDYEKKMFRYLIASVIPQMQLLENENLKPELKEKIEQFKKVIERI